MIDERILTSPIRPLWGKCVLKDYPSKLMYFNVLKKKTNKRFFMRLSSPFFYHEQGWFKSFKRVLSLNDFEYLELK